MAVTWLNSAFEHFNEFIEVHWSGCPDMQRFQPVRFRLNFTARQQQEQQQSRVRSFCHHHCGGKSECLMDIFIQRRVKWYSSAYCVVCLTMNSASSTWNRLNCTCCYHGDLGCCQITLGLQFYWQKWKKKLFFGIWDFTLFIQIYFFVSSSFPEQWINVKATNRI